MNVLLLRGTPSPKRIRGTFPRHQPTRRTCFYAAYRLGRQPMVPDLAGETGLEALESTQQEGPYPHRCRLPSLALQATSAPTLTQRRGAGRMDNPPRRQRWHAALQKAGHPSGARILKPCVPRSKARLLARGLPAARPGSCRRRLCHPLGPRGPNPGQRAQAPADSARLTQSVSAGDDEKPPVRLRPGQGTSPEIASGRRGRRFKSGHPDQVKRVP
jgi:hypothetical protein